LDSDFLGVGKLWGLTSWCSNFLVSGSVCLSSSGLCVSPTRYF
jgi:hypothetical protein